MELRICLSDGAQVPCQCDRLRVEINEEMRRRVEELVGRENVRLVAAPLGGGASARGKGASNRGNGRTQPRR